MKNAAKQPEVYEVAPFYWKMCSGKMCPISAIPTPKLFYILVKVWNTIIPQHQVDVDSKIELHASGTDAYYKLAVRKILAELVGRDDITNFKTHINFMWKFLQKHPGILRKI